MNHESRKRWQSCFNAFKRYLLNDNLKNRSVLNNIFESLPTNERLICEMVDYKDPVIKLMSSDANFRFTVEQRKYMLKDYFEDEWNENDFSIGSNSEES